MSRHPIKAVGYARISKAELGSPALETQNRLIRDFCKAHGIEITTVYFDEGISGSVPFLRREGAAAAVKAARKSGLLVVSKLDRAGRDLRDILSLIDDSLGNRAQLISVAEGFDSRTPHGRMFLSLLGSFAEFDRGRIRERTADALATRRRQGRKTGGLAPFGYSATPDLRLIKLPAEQKVLRAARCLRNEGLSYARTADALNRRKLFRRNGTPWCATKLHLILRSDDRRRSDMEAGSGKGALTIP